MRVVVSTSQWRTAKAHGQTKRVDSVRPGVHFLDSGDFLFRSLGPQREGPIGVTVIKARRVNDGQILTFPGLVEVLPVDPYR